ncbi:MAG: flagellar motor switch phosphatase FliY [Oscillospiraceae bacterium]|nr:flagellar motor switch phosphatase FliY [Oscillospiraceae bacterium]
MTNGLSQEEINALLKGEAELGLGGGGTSGSGATAAAPGGADDSEFEGLLSHEECDAIGEIGNIVMGTAATTLFSLLNNKVDITTPRVMITTMRKLAEQYTRPFISVEVQYTAGLEGTNCLFLHEKDAKVITDIMMGGDGTNVGGEFSEMHLSCISEVMNQMVGSSSTSLSQMVGTPIDISPPKSIQITFDDANLTPFKNPDEPIVKASFAMEVEGLINSEIMQVMPIPFARDMVGRLMKMQRETSGTAPAAGQPAAPAPAPSPPPASAAPPAREGAGAYAYQPPAPQNRQPMDVRPAQFTDFAGDPSSVITGENLDMLMDVPLSISVELGKSRKFIKEILDFNVGTIVVLDKMAGDLVDVVVNGKLIAQGEVVVIDDSYGCRITDVVSPSKRIDSHR